jgi:simple sugar transport system permease protein
MEILASLIATTMSAGTPLLLAALGILVSERSGVVNLGIEGLMLVAAVVGFGIVHLSGQYWLGFVAGALSGAVLALLFAALAVGLLTNQYATGLALALFGAGLSAFIGQPLQGQTLPVRGPDGITALRDIPLLGPALFSQHWLVYAALALTAAVSWFLFRSRAGLVLRAVGESPESAMRLASPCGASAAPRLLSAGRVGALPAPTLRPCTRRCGRKAWSRVAAGSHSRWSRSRPGARAALCSAHISSAV